MKSVTGNRETSLRAIAATCLIVAIPSAVLSEYVESGVAIGLVSVALLLVISPLKLDTNVKLAAGAMLAVAFATLASILIVALQPNDRWDAGGTFCLLVVFNVVMLGHSMSRLPRRGTAYRAMFASGICAFFLASLAFLLSVKVVLGSGFIDGSLSIPETLRLTILLYPGGVFLVAGLSGALLREDKDHT